MFFLDPREDSGTSFDFPLSYATISLAEQPSYGSKYSFYFFPFISPKLPAIHRRSGSA